MKYDKKVLTRFLILAFGLGWLVQLIAMWFLGRGNATFFTLVLMLAMFAPLAAAALSGAGVKNLGWGIRFKGHWGVILLSWFGPTLLTALGAALCFLLFPGTLDLSGASLPPEALAALEEQGVTVPQYYLIALVQTLLYLPFFNGVPGIGEEAGWRGVLYPMLKDRFGKPLGRVLGGLIWGVWHWPLIALVGYEYGVGYLGFPVTGMVLFCLFAAVFGTFCDWVYEKSGSLWCPAFAHGALNAAATIPVYLAAPGAMSLLIGPAPHGLLAMVPMLLVALLMLPIKGRRA